MLDLLESLREAYAVKSIANNHKKPSQFIENQEQVHYN